MLWARVSEQAAQINAIHRSGRGHSLRDLRQGDRAETGLLMAQDAADKPGARPIGVVSQPTVADETALNHRTAATCAFTFTYADRLDPASSNAARLAVSLTPEAFRTYVTDDLVGVEVGGAVKNVIAIARGMMIGARSERTRAPP
ncbi:hypothetical protein [Citreimonas salinaria]|uniref:Glycerol-3-phosphate dehydrogenase (NAD(P)+) n=1 Tax=Citreimonas salinaria TaxID=321339 RepID=A0A1H3F306_9RHOB|nr:hypothetical protein [Citreimonas salinaria]SDX85356.1 glycerol-3-phosphate dehydrogenase (NAD(P)+) [Citreimonas salinaria]